MKYLALAAAVFVLSACNSLPEKSVAPSSLASSAVSEAAAQNPAWDKSWGGADKSHDSRLLALREQIAPTFKTLVFQDPVNGVSMEYNLFVPKGYKPEDRDKRYPLVMFMADASTVGKGVKAPLMQGYGGIIWASDEVQGKHPAFVLVPSYKGPQSAVNDQWQTSPEVETTLRLLRSVMSTYSIDEQRVYATGQSMGGMIAFYLNSQYPGLFAASMFVGSQWDINVLQPLAQARFIYTVSAGDAKASAGMRQVGQMLAQKGVRYGEIELAATLPQAEQNAKVLALLQQNHRINFIRFTPNTVVPQGVVHKGGEHMYSFDYAYLLAPARDWLLSQKKSAQ